MSRPYRPPYRRPDALAPSPEPLRNEDLDALRCELRSETPPTVAMAWRLLAQLGEREETIRLMNQRLGDLRALGEGFERQLRECQEAGG